MVAHFGGKKQFCSARELTFAKLSSEQKSGAILATDRHLREREVPTFASTFGNLRDSFSFLSSLPGSTGRPGAEPRISGTISLENVRSITSICIFTLYCFTDERSRNWNLCFVSFLYVSHFFLRKKPEKGRPEKINVTFNFHFSRQKGSESSFFSSVPLWKLHETKVLGRTWMNLIWGFWALSGTLPRAVAK